MPCYEHICDGCQHEWEDIYSFKDPVPTECPECHKQGQVRRLISLPAQGVVELTGHDLQAKIKSDARKMKSDMSKSENVYANMLGEDRYQSVQTKMDKAKKERPKIKKSRKKSQ